MPKVTVYILNYNYSTYVDKAINSVLKQTYKNLEILVIDDGSTDNSLDIIKNYSDQVKVIQQNNIGLVKSILKAFSMAKGEYVVRLDADDWLAPNCIEKLVEKIEENKNIALVFPDYFEVDEFGQTIRRIKRHDFSGSGNVSMYDQPAHGACTLTRKEYYFNVGGHDDKLQCQDGVDIWLSLTEKYDVLNVSEPLFYYRKHSQSLTVNEEKILLTRSNIYKSHAQKRGYKKETTFAFIPVRSQKLNGIEYALTKLADKTVIEWIIDKAKKSELLDKIIVLADTPELSKEFSNLFSKEMNIIISERSKEDSLSGTTINGSIQNYLKLHDHEKLDNIVILTTDYPFSRHNYIDTALYSMFLFGSSSIDSVVMDNSIFYYHDGSGLKPWVETYIRKEREDIYIRRGGVSVFRHNLLKSEKDIISQKMGHVIVDKVSSFEIRSSEDIAVAGFIANELITEN